MNGKLLCERNVGVLFVQFVDPLMTSSTASDGLGRALFHAALYGYRDQCATLLDNGAPVNWINTDWR